jgi:DNA-directed RNA polymerase subunit M/transcription elongation factor TFIIS
MYYIKISEDEESKLLYYCRKCGNENSNVTEDNIVVSELNLKGSAQQFHHIINKYTKLDPTLPRIKNVPCPNPKCLTHDDKNPAQRSVINIRYDEINMKYVYICTVCDTIWKTDDKN